jgi:hypothetical protein
MLSLIRSSFNEAYSVTHYIETKERVTDELIIGKDVE